MTSTSVNPASASIERNPESKIQQTTLGNQSDIKNITPK
jgi:hypothetical protein